MRGSPTGKVPNQDSIVGKSGIPRSQIPRMWEITVVPAPPPLCIMPTLASRNWFLPPRFEPGAEVTI